MSINIGLNKQIVFIYIYICGGKLCRCYSDLECSPRYIVAIYLCKVGNICMKKIE